MAARNIRAREIAFITLLIAGIIVIGASAVTWQAYGTTHTQGTDKDLAPQVVIAVEGSAGLQHFPNVTTKPLNTASILSKPTAITANNLVPVPYSASITANSLLSSGVSVSQANTYSSGSSGKVPTPVYQNTSKSQKIPFLQSKTFTQKPVPTIRPPSTVLPLPTLIPVTPAKQTPSIIIVNDTTRQVEQRIFYYTNIERANAGEPSLKWDEQLAIIGRDDCVDMAARSFFDHINPDGETPADRAIRHGYQVEKDFGSYVRVGVGENIAMLSNYPGTPDELARFIMDAWMNSPGHRANIVDSFDQGFTVIGVGVAYDQTTDTWYAAQEFF
jgi:uncharacterized protein YkwD